MARRSENRNQYWWCEQCGKETAHALPRSFWHDFSVVGGVAKVYVRIHQCPCGKAAHQTVEISGNQFDRLKAVATEAAYWQKEVEKLRHDNKHLHDEVDQLRADLAQIKAIVSRRP